MRLSVGFTILLVAAFAAASPAQSKEDDDIITITKDFYPLEFVKYKSKHDVVNILVPLNSINFDEDDSSSSEETDDIKMTFFFIEADVDDDKKRTYKGLYSFKDNKATKILENGQDVAASSDNSKEVFIGASDGLYVYKDGSSEAVKYGPITDNIIGIAVTNASDIIYILTKDHEVYKVTDSGNTKTKLEDVVKAQQIVLDYSNNLYFYAEDKQPYVRTAEGVKKIEGLPSNPNEITLVRPPFIIDEGVPVVMDKVAYIIYANGTSEPSGFEFKPKAKPSAYGMEAAIIQYYAYDKKIYEYNILGMVLGEILEELKDYLSNKTNDIQAIARSSKKKSTRKA